MGGSGLEEQGVQPARIPKLEYKDGVWATLVVPASGLNVGHWLMDGVLRLSVLEEAGLAGEAKFISYGD